MEKEIIARFRKGNTIMSMDHKDYVLFDETKKYLSMTKFDTSNCIDGETILEISWGNGYQSVSIKDNIPSEIKGYEVEYNAEFLNIKF